MGSTVADMRIALVTGPSSGIGLVTAVELGNQGYHVVAAGRDESRVRPVVDRILDAGGSAEALDLDLASLESSREAGRRFAASGREIDVLVNNAGVGMGRGLTEDGFEIHFGVNHLGHFVLTSALSPAFGRGTRIVQVSSAAHFNADGIDFTYVRRRTRSLFGWKEYAVSKLANVLLARELARRQDDWATYAVHPGMTDTRIFPAVVRLFLRRRLLTPEQGADSVVWCAVSEEVSGESGLYYTSREPRPPSRSAQSDELAAELWERSVQWCGASPLD